MPDLATRVWHSRGPRLRAVTVVFVLGVCLGGIALSVFVDVDMVAFERLFEQEGVKLPESVEFGDVRR